MKPPARTWLARACVAGATALAAAGCGSSSPSQAQLRSQATTICEQTNRSIGRIPTPASAAGALTFLNDGIAALKPELRSLKQLSASGDAVDVWNTAIHALSAQLAALQSTASDIQAGADPVRSFKSLEQTLGPLQTQANNAWQALQIPACQNQ